MKVSYRSTVDLIDIDQSMTSSTRQSGQLLVVVGRLTSVRWEQALNLYVNKPIGSYHQYVKIGCKRISTRHSV